MKKLEVLRWGLQHIAANHGFKAATDESEDGTMCIFGGCNVPTLSDVRMLCEDLAIPSDYVESDDFGITVYMDWGWLDEGGLMQEDYVPTGMEFWKKRDVEIGS